MGEGKSTPAREREGKSTSARATERKEGREKREEGDACAFQPGAIWEKGIFVST